MAAELANSQDDRNPIKQKERQKGRPLFYFKFYSERLGVKLRSMFQCPARSCDLRLLRTQALKRQRVRQNLVTGTLDADVFIVFKRGRQHEQDITESGAARKKHRAGIAQSVRSKDCKRLSRLYAIDNHASGCHVQNTGDVKLNEQAPSDFVLGLRGNAETSFICSCGFSKQSGRVCSAGSRKPHGRHADAVDRVSV